MASADERVGEDLRDQLEPLDQRVGPVALRAQGVESQGAYGGLTAHRERDAQGRLDAEPAAGLPVDGGLRGQVLDRGSGDQPAGQHLLDGPGVLLLAHRVGRTQAFLGAVGVGGHDHPGGCGRPLPQHRQVDPERLADTAQPVLDLAVDLVGRKVDEAGREVGDQRLELEEAPEVLGGALRRMVRGHRIRISRLKRKECRLPGGRRAPGPGTPAPSRCRGGPPRGDAPAIRGSSRRARGGCSLHPDFLRSGLDRRPDSERGSSMALHPVLAEKLSDTLAAGPGAPFTARDARLPAIPGKVHSVIGMRRAGKTTFLRQLQAERRASQPAERALFLSFDDDRLGGIEVDQLGFLLEEYYRRYPSSRGRDTRAAGCSTRSSSCPAGSASCGGCSIPRRSRSSSPDPRPGCSRARSTRRCAAAAWRPSSGRSAFGSSCAIAARSRAKSPGA